MRLRVRQKLVLPSIALLVVVSFGFTGLGFVLSRTWVEDDLRERAVAFAREVAATIGDRREFESGLLMREQIQRIVLIRPNVLQLDILALGPTESRLVATSAAGQRLPFTRADAVRVRGGEVVSRLVTGRDDRHWEVIAPVSLGDEVVGAVGALFSLDQADRLTARIRTWALGLTAASVVVMAVLVSMVVRYVVDRPVGSLVDAMARVGSGTGPAAVPLHTSDEFGVLAAHFNDMVARIDRFNEELQVRVRAATTELDRRYQELQRLNALLFDMQRRLSHAERLAVSGRIMAEVAHEIGTPLHSVAGHLELLRRELPEEVRTGPLARRLDVVETQLARVTEIMTLLLNLTRRSPGEPARLDVGRVVAETVDLARPGMHAAGLHLEISTEGGLPLVRGHASQLQQVFLNLLTNAMDATSAGGRVEVRVRAGEDHGRVTVEVRDTGHGIPAAERKQIFEPFVSTKEPGRGTGLGLFISAQIVRDHGGAIEVESEPGKGSTFRVVLPVEGRAA